MKVRYIGTESYQEYPLTGTTALWQPEWVSDVSDYRADKLVALGTFVYDDESTFDNQLGSRAAELAAMGVTGTSRAVIFGTSLEAQNDYVGATYNFAQDRGWFHWMNYYSGAAWTLVKNAGVAGNTSAQMLARFADDVAAYSPNWLFIGAPINDAISELDYDVVTQPNMAAIFSAARAIGCRVVLLSMSPSTDIAGTASRRIAQAKYNAFAKAYATAIGWDFADITTPLLDPASTTGAPLTSLMWDAKTHYANIGAQRVGRAVWDSVSSPPKPFRFATGYHDVLSASNVYGNVAVNPNQLGSTGTNSGTPAPTGNVATSWEQRPEASGHIVSAVGSKVARTDVTNLEWSQSVVEFANTAANTRFRVWNPTRITLAGSGLVVGDTVRAFAEMNLVDPTTIATMHFQLVAENGSFTVLNQAVGLAWGSGAADVGLMACAGVVPVPDLVIPEGTVYLSSRGFLGGKISTAGCTGTLQLGRVDIRKVIEI